MKAKNPTPPATSMLTWERLVPSQMIDAWLERLAWIGNERIGILEIPGKKSAKLTAYGLKRKEQALLKKSFGGVSKTIKKSTWLKSQQRNFSLKLGALTIASSHKAAHPKPPHSVIVIPAGMAFGTGEHSTTALCLHELVSISNKCGPVMLDAGTGSGILALAGCWLRKKVVACDNDPTSILTARENYELNQPALANTTPPQWIEAALSDLPRKTRHQRFDLIVANLYCSIIIDSLPQLMRILKSDGKMILSGIMDHQRNEIVSALTSIPTLHISKIKKQSKWICILVENKTAHPL